MVLCPKCNTVNSDNEKYCKNCGFQLNASRICPQCGKVNQHNSKYCDECGATLSPVNSFKKDVISKEEDSSFFNRYKSALIAALILVLAIGAVAGITLYNGNDNGGGDDEPFFPLANGNNSQIEDNTALNNSSNPDDNQTLENKSDDANLTKNATATNKSSNQKKTDNKTNQVNADNQTDKVDSKKSDNQTDKVDSKKSDNPADKASPVKTENKTQKTEQINMDNKTNDSNNNDRSSNFEIKLSDVPNLAKEVADRNYKFSQIDYKGHSYSESQCIYVFSKYVIKINDEDDSAISVKSVSKAPNPSGEDLSQQIVKSDYISMAKRIVSFIDSNNAVPNYVGISEIGPKDLSPEKILYLYTQVVLNYGVTGDLPESVEI